MALDTKVFAKCVGRKFKIKFDHQFFRTRCAISLKWMKELGYQLFGDLISLTKDVREALLDSSHRTDLILYLALMNKRYTLHYKVVNTI